MPNIYEDFVRCSCGCADFKEESIITVPKTVKQRDEFHQHEPIPNVGKKIIYVCRNCGKELEV